ncbi:MULTISPECIES: efflux RND transporter periplasmic adaptor subunit [Flavobacterium]|uniref:Membrane fusion protein, Cu(I)/Ag(I) efflux system n=2 Tax=Flavobacterium TaxID=237 RepID=A0A1M6H735_9FLAO|nr:MULTISPECIES: efflux RND transporter periplasmic adaptor subunit [Flavobacterium]ESU28503.1 putative Co/Zn/Cd efflux system membrane fusion protein [Flavobacterium limnosediminis JC2902]UOK41446.1 efflux RND transporter periplasmic adaptor subunit [Flavobacterium enshiense]SHJ17986.1 membrane fusion protein, Cu(I)/Ag(I) efflux system [Flavobacterium terrae]
MNRYLKYSLITIAIVTIGFAVYYFATKSDNHSSHEQQAVVYTCSMHPEIIRDKPGNCPICGMTLVKKITNNHTEENNSIENVLKPTDNFIVGNYQTTMAKDTTISNVINLPGLVAYDPNSSVNIAARISGRIEKMYVNYKYQKVTKGQKLFDLYSPELLTEQQNFIYLISNDAANTSIVEASKQKLMLYGMSGNHINSLMATKRANPVISIYSPAYGIIDATETMEVNSNTMSNASATSEILNVKEGNYIKKGETVFKLVNTDKVWGVFNVLQGYNGLLKMNQPITITTELDENNSINANINFIETQFNASDKSNRIRVYLNNAKLKLPIGLRLQGSVKTNPIKATWLQKQAFVSIGNKKIVFIKMNNGFKAKEIKTGIEMGDYIQVINGISIKDTIAKNAQYLIDSESFIKTE